LMIEKQAAAFAHATAASASYDDNDDYDHDSALGNDTEIRQLFENTVAAMQQVISDASKVSFVGRDNIVGGSNSIKDLNDTNEGGVTRVVSVQYSEIEITPDGRHVNVLNAAPGVMLKRGGDDGGSGTGIGIDCNGDDDTEERKRQIRMASDAAVLQQEILGQLFAMDEHERNNVLSEASEASRNFQHELTSLPPGRQRIEYLQSIPLDLSRKLAMHKCWSSMLQQNGGRPPKMAPRCPHHNSK
jgi:hypothetical protein